MGCLISVGSKQRELRAGSLCTIEMSELSLEAFFFPGSVRSRNGILSSLRSPEFIPPYVTLYVLPSLLITSVREVEFHIPQSRRQNTKLLEPIVGPLS